ncbi:MAG: hypothetical protein MJ252_17410 [archaeon]|nr:hypothetical protein [archaeon]
MNDENSHRPPQDMDLTKVTWESTGKKILSSKDKFILSRHEKQLLKILLFKYEVPLLLRRKVNQILK